MSVVSVLRELGDTANVEILSRSLRDPEIIELSRKAHSRLGGTSPVAAIAEALGMLADGIAVEPLLGALADKGDNLATIARALGRLKDRRAVQPLLETLATTCTELAGESIATALGELGSPDALPGLRWAVDNGHSFVKAAAEQAIVRITAASSRS